MNRTELSKSRAKAARVEGRGARRAAGAEKKASQCRAEPSVTEVDAEAAVAKRPPVVRVGLLGLGTVGAGVAEVLERHGRLIAARTGIELRLVRALVRRQNKTRPGAAGHVPLTARAAAIAEALDVDIVCELMGGLDPAYELIKAALMAGKPVVTANKAVLARHAPELLRLAEKNGADLYFEGSVAGGLPIIRTLREGLAADRIQSVVGILNGTTNFILSRMEQGESYDVALRAAQAAGFAEADPTLDVSGRDAADKLTILLLLAFGVVTLPERIATSGITELLPENLKDAHELGFRVKLLASGRRSVDGDKRGVVASVRPTFVPFGHPLSTVSGADNAVAVESEALGLTLYQGQGAGGLPTGSAVVSDLMEAARALRAGISGRGTALLTGKGLELMPRGLTKSPFYLRLLVSDRPGVLASITRIMAEHDVSLATVLQRERDLLGKSPVPIVMLTHPASDAAMQTVAKALQRLPALRHRPQILPILQEGPAERG